MPLFQSGSLQIGFIALLCQVIGLLTGMWLQHRLPEHHLSSKILEDTVKLGAGMVATMSALILGLLVSSAKSSFDTVNVSIAQNGARVIQLDRLLADYGPETRAIRDQLKNSVAERVEKIWGKSSGSGGVLHSLENPTAILDIQSSLRLLTPQTERQKSLLNQSIQFSSEIWQSLLLMIEEQQEPVPAVFLVLLIFWLAVLFLSFGLFAPRNVTVFAVLLVCALSVSSAVFLILEMSHPLEGLVKVSRAPLLKALELIDH